MIIGIKWHSIRLTFNYSSDWFTFFKKKRMVFITGTNYETICYFLQGKSQPLERQSRPHQTTHFCDIFFNFRKKKSGMIFHDNCLPADNSHEITLPY